MLLNHEIPAVAFTSDTVYMVIPIIFYNIFYIYHGQGILMIRYDDCLGVSVQSKPTDSKLPDGRNMLRDRLAHDYIYNSSTQR